MTSSTNPKSNAVELISVSKIFPESGGLEAVSDLSLMIRKGEFICIVGPTGCGKTTILKMMAGLLSASSGEILLNGNPIKGATGESVLVFQDYSRSLLPWRNARRNIELGLEAKGIDGEERTRIARHFLNLVKLKDFEERYPRQLSGGMQQRLALARALACSPRVLLMDEPFGSLDARTKAELEDELQNVWLTLKPSVVFVTHDIEEAIYLGQRIIVLTSRPAKVDKIEDVSIGYPRNQLTTRQSNEFLSLRAKLMATLID